MNIYDSLNPEQKKAVMHQYGPLLLLAGAGSGKTRVLTHRIAKLIDDGVAPYHILALTFTNKAAKEMRDRVDNLIDFGSEDIWVGTFHSVCGKILRRSISNLGYDNTFTIYDTDDQRVLMKEVLKYLELDPKKFKERAVLSAISSAKNALLTPEAYQKAVKGDFLREKYALAYIEYQKRLFSNNALDFDDMIFRTIDLFQQCPEELKKYQQRFQYIHVDEYQDTNYAQFQLIRMLAPTEMEDGTSLNNLCVVGDDDQSIYKFRGADIYNILNFEQQFPETTVIKLEQNYRSTKNILAAANGVIRNNSQRKEKVLWTEHEEGEPIHYCQLDTDFNEADYIVSDIEKTVAENAQYQDIAILYRTNAQSRLFEEKLVRSNIPYKLIGGINFYQRREIKDLLCYLKTIDNGKDDLAVKRIINVPKRGIGQTTIDRVSDYAVRSGISFYEALHHAADIPGIGRALGKLEGFVAMIETLRQKARHAYADPADEETSRLPSADLTDRRSHENSHSVRKAASTEYTFRELLDDILEVTGYAQDLKAEGDPQAEARLENIEELKNKLAFYEQNAEDIPTLSAFLEEVSLVADIDSMEDSNNVVVLMTLHSAKGLEFPYVYLAGMEDGIFPGYLCISSDDPLEIEEERRLCYVGITRAMKRLTLTGARQRMQHGETQFNKPSRFLREIPRYLIKEEAGPLQSRFFPAARFAPEELPAVDLYADITPSFDEDSVPWEKTSRLLSADLTGRRSHENSHFVRKAAPEKMETSRLLSADLTDRRSHENSHFVRKAAPEPVIEFQDYSQKPRGMSPAEFMKQNAGNQSASLRGFTAGQRVSRQAKETSRLPSADLTGRRSHENSHSVRKAAPGDDPFAGNPLIQKGASSLSSYRGNTAPIRKGTTDFLSQPPEYAVGDQVKHIKFGTGTVMNLIKGPKDYQVTVDFGEPAGIKKMMAGFAKLQKI